MVSKYFAAALLTTALMTGVASAQANTGNKLSVTHAISEFRAESEIA